MLLVIALVSAWIFGSLAVACILARVLVRSNPDRLGEAVPVRHQVASGSAA